MHMHCMSSVHYKSNDLHAQSFMFFVQVLDAPKSAQAKVQKVCILFCVYVLFFDTVVLMVFLLETLACTKGAYKCICFAQIFCMFFIFQYFETFAERMPKQDALFRFVVCFSIFSILLGQRQ